MVLYLSGAQLRMLSRYHAGFIQWNPQTDLCNKARSAA